MKSIIILVCVLSIVACNADSKSNKKSTIEISKEIEALITVDQQREYLETISKIDQAIRHKETDQMKAFGYNSKEHKAAMHNMMETDIVNLQKIEEYLKVYGHPSIVKHGEDACGTPWIVIHHSSGGLDVRRRNFKHIFNAYLNKDINDGSISFYLNRMYRIKYGKMIFWDRPFGIKEELDTLYNSLNLMDIVTEVRLESIKNEP